MSGGKRVIPKNIATAILIACLFVPSFAEARGGGGHSSGGHSSSGDSGTGSSGSSHSVSGYTKQNGTHVAPSHATNPNATQRDNFSAKGNMNPYTGKVGSKPVTH